MQSGERAAGEYDTGGWYVPVPWGRGRWDNLAAEDENDEASLTGTCRPGTCLPLPLLGEAEDVAGRGASSAAVEGPPGIFAEAMSGPPLDRAGQRGEAPGLRRSGSTLRPGGDAQSGKGGGRSASGGGAGAGEGAGLAGSRRITTAGIMGIRIGRHGRKWRTRQGGRGGGGGGVGGR